MNYLPTTISAAAAEVLFIFNNGPVTFFGRSPCWKEHCEKLQYVEGTNIMLPFFVNYNPNRVRTVAANRNSFYCFQCCCCFCCVAGVCRDDNLFLF